jgi:hypothetical protein
VLCRRGRGGVSCSRSAQDGGDEARGGPEQAVCVKVAHSGSVMASRAVVGSGPEAVRLLPKASDKL